MYYKLIIYKINFKKLYVIEVVERNYYGNDLE